MYLSLLADITVNGQFFWARCYCANGMNVEKNTALKFAYHWVILLKVTVILWCKYMTNYFEGLYLECHN